MKLILTIASSDDSATVQAVLTKKHFSIIKLAATDGFLRAGSITFIVGVEDDKAEEVISEIAIHSSRRIQIVPSASAVDMGPCVSFPVKVAVGGSAIFVMNVE